METVPLRAFLFLAAVSHPHVFHMASHSHPHTVCGDPVHTWILLVPTKAPLHLETHKYFELN